MTKPGFTGLKLSKRVQILSKKSVQLWIEVNVVTLHKLSEELKAVQWDILHRVTLLWPGSEMIENIGKQIMGPL